jgi:hypothetical protein
VGQEHLEDRTRRFDPQKGQMVSDAGGVARSFSPREGSLGERRRCLSVSNAPMGAARRITQTMMRASGVGGMAQNAAVKMRRTTKPANLKPRRVPGWTWGWRPQTVQCQRV